MFHVLHGASPGPPPHSFSCLRPWANALKATVLKLGEATGSMRSHTHKALQCIFLCIWIDLPPMWTNLFINWRSLLLITCRPSTIQIKKSFMFHTKEGLLPLAIHGVFYFKYKVLLFFFKTCFLQLKFATTFCLMQLLFCVMWLLLNCMWQKVFVLYKK